MRILILGSGGREHALAWKLGQEHDVFVGPGNAGISGEFDCLAVDLANPQAIVELAQQVAADLVVFGPEDPLIEGAADWVRNAELPVFGPGREAARLEGSKAFSKQLMTEAAIPTAAFTVVRTIHEAEAAIASARERGKHVVVKASGAALGKGVVVCSGFDQAHGAVSSMLNGSFGEAGRTVVIEDRLEGYEFSLLTLVSPEGITSFPVAQDFKRIFDGNLGPNTGGMGSYSPVPTVTEAMSQEAEERVVKPILDSLKTKGIDYRGLLFSGLMVDSGKLYCLEYNVRFGDPETQSLMMRTGSGLAENLLKVAQGGKPEPIALTHEASVTVVMSSKGYPESSQKGIPIEIGIMPDDVRVFHSATAWADGRLVTNGGRVLAVSAAGQTIEEARQLAYAGIGKIRFEGEHFRTDIAGAYA